jgi:hypothetical protein
MALNDAITELQKALKENIGKAHFYGIWQFRLLILGAVFFVLWRVLEMIRITE